MEIIKKINKAVESKDIKEISKGIEEFRLLINKEDGVHLEYISLPRDIFRSLTDGELVEVIETSPLIITQEYVSLIPMISEETIDKQRGLKQLAIPLKNEKELDELYCELPLLKLIFDDSYKSEEFTVTKEQLEDDRYVNELFRVMEQIQPRHYDHVRNVLRELDSNLHLQVGLVDFEGEANPDIVKYYETILEEHCSVETEMMMTNALKELDLLSEDFAKKCLSLLPLADARVDKDELKYIVKDKLDNERYIKLCNDSKLELELLLNIISLCNTEIDVEDEMAIIKDKLVLAIDKDIILSTLLKEPQVLLYKELTK